MSVLVTIKCPCSTCSERIEYPPDMCGKQITCPHCQQATMLLAPQISPEALKVAPVPAAPQSPAGGPPPPQLDGSSTNKTVRIDQTALVPAPPGPGAPPPAPPGSSAPPPAPPGPSAPPPAPPGPGAPPPPPAGGGASPPPSTGKPPEDDPYATMKSDTAPSPTPPAKGGGAPPPPPTP